jgi:hypothetical protein
MSIWLLPSRWKCRSARGTIGLSVGFVCKPQSVLVASQEEERLFAQQQQPAHSMVGALNGLVASPTSGSGGGGSYEASRRASDVFWAQLVQSRLLDLCATLLAKLRAATCAGITAPPPPASCPGLAVSTVGGGSISLAATGGWVWHRLRNSKILYSHDYS